MGVPIFVTRVKVGRGRDMVLISAESPAGETSRGEVETLEAVRFVVSPATFAEITELFVRTLKSMDLPAQPGMPDERISLDNRGGNHSGHHKHNSAPRKH